MGGNNVGLRLAKQLQTLYAYFEVINIKKKLRFYKVNYNLLSGIL